MIDPFASTPVATVRGNRGRTKLGTAAFAALLVAALLPHPGDAHVVPEPRSVVVGAPFKVSFRVTHGCEGSPTLRVVIRIPDGVIGVKPMAKPGWDIETVRGPYPKAYPYFHGTTLSEGVREVIFKGRLPDDWFDEFTLSGSIADDLTPGTTLAIPVRQDCEKGTLNWVEVPTGSEHDAHLQAPAPSLMLRPKN